MTGVPRPGLSTLILLGVLLGIAKEMRAYLECGILAYGFVRARCQDCGASRAVAFSCKKRGLCPSCCGRRMADTAARLVDEVLPRVPVRQWVLSFPYEMPYRLAYDGEWVSKVLAVFLRVVGGWYRRQAQAMGHGNARWGSVTFVQRFGSSLNLNPHVHVLMLDGVYVDGDEAPVFVPAPPLSDPDVQQIVQTSARRIIRLCTRHGLLDDTVADRLAEEEPVLAALTAASVRRTVATGERAGQRLRRALQDPAPGVRTAPLCFASRGFSLHAATRIAGPDRGGLERLCRYVARPALASGRLRLLDWQRLSFALKTPWSDGTPPSPALADGTAGEAGGSGAPAPVPSPALPRGPGPPCPRPRPHRARQAGCRAGGGLRCESSVLRPSPGVGGPAGPGVWRRPQRMRSLWRWSENHRRPDRSGLDPDLSGGGRAAGGAPAGGPAAAAVGVRRLTSSAMASRRR